jgi:hypothetical protein
MLRIPNSINSKSNQQVRIVQHWNGIANVNTTTMHRIRPSIRPLLYEFYIYLADLKFNEIIGINIKTRRNNNSKYSKYWNDKSNDS